MKEQMLFLLPVCSFLLMVSSSAVDNEAFLNPKPSSLHPKSQRELFLPITRRTTYSRPIIWLSDSVNSSKTLNNRRYKTRNLRWPKNDIKISVKNSMSRKYPERHSSAVDKDRIFIVQRLERSLSSLLNSSLKPTTMGQIFHRKKLKTVLSTSTIISGKDVNINITQDANIDTVNIKKINKSYQTLGGNKQTLNNKSSVLSAEEFFPSENPASKSIVSGIIENLNEENFKKVSSSSGSFSELNLKNTSQNLSNTTLTFSTKVNNLNPIETIKVNRGGVGRHINGRPMYFTKPSRRKLEMEYACNFTDMILNIVEVVIHGSFCTSIESRDLCMRGADTKMVPKIGLMCDESYPIQYVSDISNSSRFVTVLVIKNQQNLLQLFRADFHDYGNLVNLTVKNSSLTTIEPETFGVLVNLKVLDLSGNSIHQLHWKILYPSIISRDPKILNLIWQGNPLNTTSCTNLWLWERRNQEGVHDVWSQSSRRLERPGNGIDRRHVLGRTSRRDSRSFDSSNSRNSDSWKVQILNSRDIQNLASNDTQEFKTSRKAKHLDVRNIQSFQHRKGRSKLLKDKNIQKKVRREKYHHGTFSDCFMSKNHDEELQCYFCPPRLSILSKNGKILKVQCEASGVPTPEIAWELENDSFVIEGNPSLNPPRVLKTITINTHKVLEWASTLHPSNSSLVNPVLGLCKAFNDRAYGQKSICDLEELSLKKLYPKTTSSYVNFEFRISSRLFFLDPRWWKWSFSPCTENVSLNSNFTLTFSSRVDRSNKIIRAALHYSRSDLRGFLPGWYKLEVQTPCGKLEKEAQYFEGAPHQNASVECPLEYNFQEFHVTTVSLFQFSDSIATAEGISSKIRESTVMPKINVTEYDATTNSNGTVSTTQTAHTLPIGVWSLVLIGIFSVLIVMVWISALVVMRHWKGNHIFLSQASRNYESPFKIVFLRCLCRDKEPERKNHGGAEDFARHEMHLLNPDRLVDNPEYMSSSEPEELELKSSKQVPVILSAKLKFLSELGEGAFGRVYLGLMEDSEGKTTKIAIKTLKALGPEGQADVKREVNMLNDLQHDNIVTFYGVSNDHSESLLMIFEYMEHGDLNHYLRLHNEECAPSSDSSTVNTDPLTIMDCLQIALQIAAGMTYLASQHYVHRDLATRNCLVAANLLVKIGDFGMSRDVYTSDYYQIGGRALLPVRWMPPESILYRRFTIDSDIWSFGVVLWEIFTGGKQPWYGYTNQEVIIQITAGKMLFCPEKCPPDMYHLIVTCWAKQPQDRMSMQTLYRRIKGLTTLQPCLDD